MVGIPGALFLPLALAIGFSMVFSFLLSQTFVPVMANWLMKGHAKIEHAPNITDDEAEFLASGITPESEKDIISQKGQMVEKHRY